MPSQLLCVRTLERNFILTFPLTSHVLNWVVTELTAVGKHAKG